MEPPQNAKEPAVQAQHRLSYNWILQTVLNKDGCHKLLKMGDYKMTIILLLVERRAY